MNELKQEMYQKLSPITPEAPDWETFHAWKLIAHLKANHDKTPLESLKQEVHFTRRIREEINETAKFKELIPDAINAAQILESRNLDPNSLDKNNQLKTTNFSAIITGFIGILLMLTFSIPVIIGSGIQAQFQAKCLASLMPERPFNFNIWGRNISSASILVEELQSNNLNADVAKNLDEEVSLADIIITTTPATSPLFGDNLVRPGTHITAIGADTHGKQELPTSLIETVSLLVCDMTSQSLNHGEFQVINDTDLSKKVVELGNILSNSCAGRASDNDITIADLTGIAAQDIAITSGIIDAAEFEK